MAWRWSLLDALLGTAATAFLLAWSQANTTFTKTFFLLLPGTLSVYLLFWSWIYPFYLSPLRVIPTVPGFPLWGHLYDILTCEVGIPQRRWHQQHGLIVRYFFPFGTERLSIADDDALKHMTLRNPYNYPKPLRIKLWMGRVLGEGVLLAEGDEHIRQRKALTPAFSPQNIRNLAPIFWQKALQLSCTWLSEFQEVDNKTRSFEILEWLNRTTLDIIGKAGFGTDFNTLDNADTPLRHAYRLVFAFDVVSHAMHGLHTLFPSTRYIPSKMNSDVEESRRIIAGEATEIVRQKLNAPDKDTAKDILSVIVRENELASSTDRLRFENMRDQVMTFLGAGHDTTATGVAWTLHLLATRPEIQEKLRAEINAALPNLSSQVLDSSNVSPENLAKFDVDHLKYLNNVCRESLRYIPPIPMTSRQSREDDFLAGYFIPKGTTVYVLANAINRLPSFWGNRADEFIPERWDDLPDDHPTSAYMTFLQGPRGCIGRKFAETEMKILLCVLLSVFQFSPRTDVENPENLKMWRLVLRPRDGILLKATLLDRE